MTAMRKQLFSLVVITFLALFFAGCSDSHHHRSAGDGNPEETNTSDISLSPSSVDFAGVVLGNSLDKTIVITNAGSAGLNIGQISISNPAFSIVAPDAASNTTLAPSASCEVSVRFSPAAQGQTTATLSIPTNDPDAATATISLGGEGYGLNVWINDVKANCPSMSLDVTVTDPVNASNNPINSLVKANFKLYVNGLLQDFTLTPIEDPSPVSLVLALDSSKSLYGITPELKAAANGFIDRLTGDDEAAICKFTENVWLYPVLDNSFDPATNTGKTALKLYLNDDIDPGSGTSLYDAVYESVERAASGDNDTRAVIIFSDGSDSDGTGTGAQGSDHSLNEAIAFAQQQQIPVFTIFYVDPDYLEGARGNPAVMQELASQTGGQFYNANTADIDSILKQISNVLSNKYTLTFTPPTCSGAISLDVRVDFGDLYGLDSRTVNIP